MTGQEEVIDTEIVRRGAYLGTGRLGQLTLGGLNGTGLYAGFFPGLSYRGSYPWDWAVCHTGSWIRRERRYVWVVGRKRHHHPPVHWVKVGGNKGYVPIHPRDVAGKPPVNLKDGLFALRKGDSVERIAFDPKATVKLLDGAAKEFNKESFAPLERAETPKMEARSAWSATPAGKEIAVNRHGGQEGFHAGQTDVSARHEGVHAGQATTVPILFNAKTQSFSVAREVVEGGKTTTVVQPFASAQERGGYSGGGAIGASGRTEGASAGSGGGYSRAAPSGGGGYRGGGGGAAAVHSAPSGGGGGAAAGGTHH